ECRKYSWSAVSSKWIQSYRSLAAKKPDLLDQSRATKLRGMNFDELRVRSAQAVAAFSERRGWSRLAKLPADADLVKSLFPSGDGKQFRTATEVFAAFRLRESNAFFASSVNREETVR